VVLDGQTPPNVTQVTNAYDACAGAAALAIMTPWREFAIADLSRVRELLRGRVVIDPFACLDGRRCTELGLRHFRLGVPASTEEAVR
jgi:UDPglucose 6-dehydrogenase